MVLRSGTSGVRANKTSRANRNVIGNAARSADASELGTRAGPHPDQLTTDAASAAPAPDLDTAVALLELGGHPHILGREALAVLDAAGCAGAVALVADGARRPARRRRRAAGPRPKRWPPPRTPDPLRPHPARTAPRRALAAPRRAAARARPPLHPRRHPQAGRHRRSRSTATAATRSSAPRCGRPRRSTATPTASGSPSRSAELAPRRPPHRARRRSRSCSPARPAPARKCSRARSTAPPTAPTGRSLPFNCTAVPRDMLESQLFGYRKGAFTGADTSFAGVIRAAAGGTLFLDEIGDLRLDLQPKLLRFLETHEIHPLGEPQPIKVDVRVIAATNANLEQLVAEGRFREDLFYRLNVVRLRAAAAARAPRGDPAAGRALPPQATATSRRRAG